MNTEEFLFTMSLEEWYWNIFNPVPAVAVQANRDLLTPLFLGIDHYFMALGEYSLDTHE